MANELHTMPLKCEKLLSSTAIKEMTNEQFGAYIKLLCYSWLNGGYVNGNANALRRHCDCITEDEWQRIKPVIDRWFDITNDNGEIANSHLLEIYKETMEKTNRRSLAGKISAEKRWSNGNANAMPTQCQGSNNQSQSQSQIDICISNKEKSKPKKVDDGKIKFGDCGNVLMRQAEYDSLKNDLGEDVAFKCVAKLDAYKGATGKKYKSDYLAIKNWVIKAVVEDSGKQSKTTVKQLPKLTLADFAGDQESFDEFMRNEQNGRA